MDLLEGTRRRVVLELEGEKKEEEEKEEEIQDITQEKLIRQLKKLKIAKALRENDIENEIYAKGNRRGILEVIKQYMEKWRITGRLE